MPATRRRPTAPVAHPATAGLARDQAVLIGSSWYPEMWPESEWEKDAQRMREIGFRIVRLFEFAWHRFEPKEGRFDVAWAKRVLDVCHRHGIQVMVGTPSAAPPAWLTTKYPDVLLTDADGTRSTHGQRKHFNHHSARYRRLAERVTTKMAEAFASHPALHSWQIDNEMSGFDYGPESRRLFHRWLRARYGTIAKLNAAWGLEFWSQAYDRFEQIPMPVAAVGSIEIPERHHPSLLMAIARFQNEGWTRYIAGQCDAIRAATRRKKAPAKPITTNMTASFQMDWYAHNAALDRVGFSMYADLQHYHFNLYKFDRMRAEKRAPDGTAAPYWLLETAPSWSAGGRIWNIHNDERGVATKTWLSHALGGSMVLYWQWREHWAGQEMQHGTLVTATGRWRPNRDAIARLAAQATEHGPWLLANPPAPADVAILLSTSAAWGFSIDPIDDGLRYEPRWREDCYLPLARRHVWRDVIGEHADFTPYKVIVLPMMPIITADARRRLAGWVRAGGRLLLGPLVGARSEEFTAFTDREFGGLEELIGATSALRFTPHWVEDKVRVVFADGAESRTKTWCEAWAPAGATVRAHYRGGYGDGLPAVLDHRCGQGRVITLGSPVDETTYARLALELMADAGVAPVAQGSGDVVVVPRGGTAAAPAGWALVNLKDAPQVVTLPGGGIDRLGGGRVAGAVTLQPLQTLLVERG